MLNSEQFDQVPTRDPRRQCEEMGRQEHGGEGQSEEVEQKGRDILIF